VSAPRQTNPIPLPNAAKAGKTGALHNRQSVPHNPQSGISNWLRLLRWPNLLIIFLTQAAVWWCVLLPLGENALVLDRAHFLLLSFSTVCIAAAGYLINDYFDIRIDAINRPQKFILETRIHRRIAILLHSGLNIAGLVAAAVVARRGGGWWPLLLTAGCTVLLWIYSTHLKRRFAVGNIAVALLTALAVVVLAAYEPALRPWLQRSPILTESAAGAAFNPAWVLAGYAYFAFVLTWMREVVKDMEDMPGDAAEGCDTMPIRWGLLRSSRFVQLLGIAAAAPLAYGAVRAIVGGGFVLLGGYLLVAVVLPLLWWTARLTRGASTAHYAAASRQLKILMVLGVGFLALYRYA